MSLGNPTNAIIIVLLGLAAIIFVVASLIDSRKWRRLYQEEREEYASYTDGADRELRTARERIAELERNHGVLQQQHSDALVSIAKLKAEAAARPSHIAPVIAAPKVEEPAATEPVIAETETTMAPAPVAPQPWPVMAEPRPIAPEPVAETVDARPIAGMGTILSERPPAPIKGVTPLRAPEPDVATQDVPAEGANAEAARPSVGAEPVTEASPVVTHHAPVPTEIAAAAPTIESQAPPSETAIAATLAETVEAARTDERPHETSVTAEHNETPHVVEPPAHVAAEPVVEPRTPIEAPDSHIVGEPVADPPAETIAAVTAPVAESASPVPEQVAEPVKSWFGAGRRDDLTRLRGVDPALGERLFALGVTTYDDIVQLSQEDEMALEQRLPVPAGYITREQWRTQAGLLRFGKEDEFNQRFGTIDA